MRLITFTCISFLLLIAGACSDEKDMSRGQTLFSQLDREYTGIDFINQVDYTESLNTYTFKNFYNGGGVGIGDFNNDGLEDLFFTGNLVSNRLYLNLGHLQFRDITESAGLLSEGSWSTGVSIADINGDGFLDIYVCKSGPPGGDHRHNELFINSGNLTFTEESSKYGLDFLGLSTHAGFFDYDRDGDLDCYLLNNSIRSVGAYDLRKDQRKIPDPLGGNKLLRNDSGKFNDVSAKAGIYTSAIGFGLGVTIGDVNKDGWPDFFVSNDFFEKDYLYINQKDGTFRESLEDMMHEISLGSMGADMADINNDALPEIFVTEMLPESDDRLKTTTQFENWDKYQNNVEQGYYHQFSRNVMQLNNGDGTFSEIGRLSGVHATDWSWGALIVDMDNDGNKDIFVANGIYKDLLDQDYVNFVSNPNRVRQILQEEGQVIKQLIDSIPTNRISNFAFQNQGDLLFKNRAEEWGLSEPSHSNGSAYADLDNDGDLELVLNNINMRAAVYENLSDSLLRQNSFLSVSLKGEGKNTFAVGAKVTLFAGGKTFYQEHFPSRGFMSSVGNGMVFGVGPQKVIDSIVVKWPDDRITTLRNIEAGRRVELSQKESVSETYRHEESRTTVLKGVHVPGVDFKHHESDFVDFDRERLLFNMISNEGPCLCSGDVNNDKLEDFYIGGAKNQAGRLYVQTSPGYFTRALEKYLDPDSASEDTDCVFFDANGDGKQDLYVTSGGNEFSATSSAYLDRLYFNLGKGGFEKSKQLLPIPQHFESTSTVEATDFDRDGDEDLFVGVRVHPWLYGVPCNGYILMNDGRGNFTDATPEAAHGLTEIGMIRDAKWVDVNNDSWPDLIVVGDWMGIRLFMNGRGKLTEKTNAGFIDSNGWYNTVEAADLNQDGRVDFVAGNHGLNSRFKASGSEPVEMYVNDFDKNSSVEHIITRYSQGRPLPLVLRQDLVVQIPSLKKKYLHYDRYKGQTISDIFTPEQLLGSVHLSAYSLETAVWLNNGDDTFRKVSLPLQAQFFPVYAIFIDDLDGDGVPDILLGGNQRRAKPETGIYNAGYGLFLKGRGDGGFIAVSSCQSGVSIDGEIRAIKRVSGKKKILAVARNNDKVQFLQY